MNAISPKLEMKRVLWTALIADLCKRGNAKRESGAFLLGHNTAGIRRVERWIPYDELDKNALTAGYVRLGTPAFTALWSICATLELEVVADVHTHPLGPRQSASDRANPMVARPGHIALIVPNFAQGLVLPSSTSVNVYQGSKHWCSFFGRDAEERIRLL